MMDNKVGTTIGKFELISTGVIPYKGRVYGRRVYTIKCKICGKVHKDILEQNIKNKLCCDYLKNPKRISPDCERLKELIGTLKGSYKCIGMSDKRDELTGDAMVTVQCTCGYKFDMRLLKFEELEGSFAVCKQCVSEINSPKFNYYRDKIVAINMKSSAELGIEDDFNIKLQKSKYVAMLNLKKYLDELGFDPKEQRLYRKDTSLGWIKGNMYCHEIIRK